MPSSRRTGINRREFVRNAVALGTGASDRRTAGPAAARSVRGRQAGAARVRSNRPRGDRARRAQVVEPRFVPGLPDEPGAIREAAAASPSGPHRWRTGQAGQQGGGGPQRHHPRHAQRPHPAGRCWRELEAAGVRREDITLLNALGTHRRRPPPSCAPCWAISSSTTTAASSTTPTTTPTWSRSAQRPSGTRCA